MLYKADFNKLTRDRRVRMHSRIRTYTVPGFSAPVSLPFGQYALPLRDCSIVLRIPAHIQPDRSILRVLTNILLLWCPTSPVCSGFINMGLLTGCTFIYRSVHEPI